jgi:hypothetical protein
MAHYAFLDENNIVTSVIVGKDENDLAEGVTDWEQYYGDFVGQVCKRTSYNTYAGQHKFGGEAYRKNYAGIGYTYDVERNAFIAPKPFDSWLLNEDTCLWNPLVSYPSDGKEYEWDESTTNWVEI